MCIVAIYTLNTDIIIFDIRIKLYSKTAQKNIIYIMHTAELIKISIVKSSIKRSMHRETAIKK